MESPVIIIIIVKNIVIIINISITGSIPIIVNTTIFVLGIGVWDLVFRSIGVWDWV